MGEHGSSAFASASALSVEITGMVQGVGFRPYAVVLARRMGIKGYVCNTVRGAYIHAEGEAGAPARFLTALLKDMPEHAGVSRVEHAVAEHMAYDEFSVEKSRYGTGTPRMLPDLAPCPECLKEMRDPTARRYRYPFTNCAHCGPRYSIIEAMPYDRERTGMRAFPMCAECRREYEDVTDRRFHAQPIACPRCGPRLSLLAADGAELARGTDAVISAAVCALKAGKIVALKGVGGFQLLADAANEEAVMRLRRRKGRDAKPFGVMVADVAGAEDLCPLNDEERRLLTSPAAPMVLAAGGAGRGLAPSVCSFSRYVGVMLPASPLHVLLMDEFKSPVVATSGNMSGEPLCTSTTEACEKLGAVADVFLTHNRPILRPADDSVARVAGGKTVMMRRARGYAPAVIHVNEAIPPTVPPLIALGGVLKNTLCFYVNGQAVMSPHLGDLDSVAGRKACEKTLKMMADALRMPEPFAVVTDAHPDGAAQGIAGELKRSGRAYAVIEAQHHEAHVLACALENATPLPALGIAWDGAGYGADGTVWGGEFFLMKAGYENERVGRLLPFMLPGGDAAAHEPARVACALLRQMGHYRAQALQKRLYEGYGELKCRTMNAMMRTGINSPLCSSMGRLFDGVAFWCGFNGEQGCEGHAAMMLEKWAVNATGPTSGVPYRWSMDKRGGLLELDWRPVLQAVNDDLAMGTPKERMARKFHESLCMMAFDVAAHFKMNTVALGGGCFQNALLLEGLMKEAQFRRSRLDLPQRIPCNDGGISLGQLHAASRLFQSLTINP